MSKAEVSSVQRPPRLPDGAPLDYAPNNEMGVIYLFSHLARRRYGLHVEKVRAGFPDCIAYRQGKRVRIEFEFRSHNFCTHGHCLTNCDWIVCWIHDWPGVPSHIRVVELRKEFGLGFNVWFQPIQPKYASQLKSAKFNDSWSVPRGSMQDDLLLIYTSGCCIRDLFKVAGPVAHLKAGWKDGKDWFAPIRRVCALHSRTRVDTLAGGSRSKARFANYPDETWHRFDSARGSCPANCVSESRSSSQVLASRHRSSPVSALQELIASTRLWDSSTRQFSDFAFSSLLDSSVR